MAGKAALFAICNLPAIYYRGEGVLTPTLNSFIVKTKLGTLIVRSSDA